MGYASYSSNRSDQCKQVYGFILECADYLERLRGEDILPDAFRQSPQEFEKRWNKMNRNHKKRLTKLAKKGTESFFLRLKKDKDKDLEKAAYDQTPPVNDRRAMEVYRELKTAIEEDF